MGSEVVDFDLQFGADRRQLVGEEHVARRSQAVEDVDSVPGREVEAQALLSPIGVLEEDVDVAAQRHCATGGQASHGVAPLDVLDLDYLRSQVGEKGGRSRYERVLRHLEDAHALHD